MKFKNRGKVYFFDPHGIAVRTGEKVVVETSRGLELAECVQGNHAVPDETVVQPLRSLARIATKDDLRIEEINRRREKEAFAICKQKIAEHGLDMKLVDVECSFEGNKTMFFFTSDGRVDFRELVKDLASVFRNRIELRQIGVRDEAKMLGGIGICGRPYCCSQFLDDFQPVSTKMAKVQSMSLNPSKISGACGRLMCCLRYEQAAYEELVKAVPKVGAFVETPAGYGTVSSVNILRSSLKVKLDGQGEDVFKNYQADEIAVIPGGRPKPGEPLPSLLKDRPKPVREEEPKEDPWALPQLFADEVYGDKKPERARTPESGEKKKRPRRRSRGHGGKKPADAQAAPKAAQEGAKSKGQPRQKSQPNRKSGARKPGDKPAGENAERSRAKAQPPKPAEGAAPNGEKRADGAESNAGIRCTGWLISKLHPTKIKGAHCKFTAVYQFTFQRDTTIFLSFLHGNSLWSQSLIMYYLNTLAQPKEITHSQNSFLWNKIKKRGCYLSGHSQIRNNSYSLLFLTGQLRLYFKCTDTFYFISEKVNTVRIFRGKRKDINNTAPNSILSGLVHIIYIFKTVTMQYVCDKSRIQLLANIQFQCFVTQFFA